MQQFQTLWSAMDMRKRVTIGVVTLAMFGAVLALGRMAASPGMDLLFAGLEGSAAAEVVTALEQQGVAHEVRGGAIFVDRRQRDSLRMTLAGEGLPRTGGKGYELLDELSGFGTTSQMFDAAYWRAKEGELARTILSHPSISAARVHIAGSAGNPFQRDLRPTASVAITADVGGIPPAHARALRFLVASAVAGLAPADVTVIDASGMLVGVPEETQTETGEDRADLLRQRLMRLLEARVGPGNAVVELSVETERRRESVRERRVDPQSRVAISTDNEERSDSATGQGSGAVTVASNLPDGEAGHGDSSSNSNETRERVNYEVSTTEREMVEPPGAIRRLSVAVLVNGRTLPAADGPAGFEPRDAEELAALRDLVASAVGFDAERGDVITLKSMAFETAPPLGTAARPGIFQRLGLDAMALLQTAVLGIVAMVLGLFVLRPLLKSTPQAATAQLSSPAAADRDLKGTGAKTSSSRADPTALTGEIEEGEYDGSPLAVIPDAPGLADDTRPGETPVERLRALIGERQEETVEILRNWLEGEEEKV